MHVSDYYIVFKNKLIFNNIIIKRIVLLMVKTRNNVDRDQF